MARLVLVLGGARSGKSAFAERLAAGLGSPATYLATGSAGDEEMARRLAAHRSRRSPTWVTVEAPHAAGEALRGVPEGVVLLDCLSFLVANCLGPAAGDVLDAADEAAARRAVEGEVAALLAAQAERRGPLVVVSNEVGLGLVPPYPLGRLYRDLLGWANQAVAAAASDVYLLVAGLPQTLKGDPPPPLDAP
ncbi:MAG: bifunctional adenosylcobinamide kinase/adenosylcobinamide-phosphate guanylyltransferase [Chloroflexi bacterium]|nr:bifunctional adenosylcobinamide kinase/adenosylcobinamide-phosphate guanylyltransferase [Chloroflexota bacterium]